MKGIKNYKGDRNIDNQDYHIVEDNKLLLQELQNFVNISAGDCAWDIRHGLDRNILLSRNESAIKSEINNKIIEYYGDRVLDVYDMVVTFENTKTIFSCKIKTIYGQEYEIGGAR